MIPQSTRAVYAWGRLLFSGLDDTMKNNRQRTGRRIGHFTEVYIIEKIQIGEGTFMFEMVKEKARQRQEKRQEEARQRQEEIEREIRAEKDRLLSLSEKELLVEILLELRDVEDRIDDVESSIQDVRSSIYFNSN